MWQLPPAVEAEHTLELLDVEFLYYALVFAVMGLWIFFGVTFLARSSRAESAAQAAYWRSFGIFVILAAFFEILFVIDLYFEAHGAAPLLRRPEDYGIVSINYNDFFVVMPTIMAVCAANLIYPLEKYILKKPRAKIALTYLILAPTPILLRVVEVNLEAWLGIPLEATHENLPFVLISVAWGLMLVVAFATGIFLMTFYARMGHTAPPGSTLRHKAHLIQVGIVVWTIGMVTTLSIWENLWRFWAEGAVFGKLAPFFTPAMLLVSLLLMAAGFSRTSTGDE